MHTVSVTMYSVLSCSEMAQRSLFVPLLFTIFVNGYGNCLRYSNLRSFANYMKV